MKFHALYRVMAVDAAIGLSGQMASMGLLSSLVLAGEGGAGTVLGFSTALQFPVLVAAIVGGPFLDRWGCGTALLPLYLVRGIVIVTLAFCWPSTLASVVLLSIAACLDTLFHISRNALMPDLADGRSLVYANGIMLRVGVAGGLLGPVIAGYTISWGGTGLCLAGTGWMCVALSLLLIRLPAGRALYPKLKWKQEIMGGFKYSLENSKVLRGIVILGVSSLGAGLMNFAVPLLLKSRGLPVNAYGVFLASFALGQMAASFIFPRLFPGETSLPCWTFVIQGMGMAGTLYTQNVVGESAAFAVMGLGSGASQIFLDSFFQREAVTGYRSRVIAFAGALRIMCCITAAVVGAAASWAGAVILVTAASVTTIFSGFLSKAICSGLRYSLNEG
jgi:MFS family permease